MTRRDLEVLLIKDGCMGASYRSWRDWAEVRVTFADNGEVWIGGKWA
jgi:hypothetical protein